MDFCEQNGIDFVFGITGNGTLDRAVEITADDIRTCRWGFRGWAPRVSVREGGAPLSLCALSELCPEPSAPDKSRTVLISVIG
jgi:hypothetical protein